MGDGAYRRAPLKRTQRVAALVALLVVAAVLGLHGLTRHGDLVRLLQASGALLAQSPALATTGAATPLAVPFHWELLDGSGRSKARGGTPAATPVVRHVQPAPAAGGAGATVVLTASMRPLLAQLAAGAAAALLLCLAVHLLMERLASAETQALLAAQREEHLRFHTAIDNMSQGLCFFDGERRLIVCNGRYATMYGLKPDDVRPGTTLEQIVDRRFEKGTCPAMSRQAYLEWRHAVAIGNEATDTVSEMANGRVYAIHHQPMPGGGWVATHEDITERRRASAQIERMATHDALTGLPNRLLFRERLEDGLRRQSAGDGLAVLCIDLDHFKSVNDTLGHQGGDDVLRAVAQRLRECVRDTDLVARLGGDEFAIIQAGCQQPASAQALGERLVQAMSEHFVATGSRVILGASVGAALSPEHGQDAETLLKRADLAMYGVKAAGRSGLRFFHPEMDAAARERRALEADLRNAVDGGELLLYYQPITSLRSRRVVAFEALLRWRHPQRGMVMPDSFIPLAEETGLIETLGEWVLGEAFRCAADWPEHVAVAVNLSPVQIQGGRLVATVAAALQASGLAPERVELEITETVLLMENDANLATLHALQALGVRICLDDFGVGYSSLSYLRSFPFKKIKVDRSFVRDIEANTQAASIVRAIASLGEHLGMVVTAEGVETAAQFSLLQALGCNEAQGYHLSRPQPASEIGAMLALDRWTQPAGHAQLEAAA